LGHVTRKIVPEMTYNVSSGTLNPTVLSGTRKDDINFNKKTDEVALLKLQYFGHVAPGSAEQFSLTVLEGTIEAK